MIFGTQLNKRALERIAIAEQRAKVAEAEVTRLQKSARLIAIEASGRELRLGFLRDGNPFTLTTYRTMDLDLNAIRTELLGLPD